jgi:hypothetical protein
MNRLPRLTFALPLAFLLIPATLAQTPIMRVFTAPGAATNEADRGGQASKDNTRVGVVPQSELTHPVMWQQPADIASRDLYWGQGGQKSQPQPPFTFEREVMTGTNPAFDVRDAKGDKWRVTLGEESRPEVVASRLLWAVGYYANDDYLLPSATVSGLALQRGKDHMMNSTVTDARFQRLPGGDKKIGIWKWSNNPFTGTRQGNGLRVMMAVINNWDLKDQNNAVYQDAQTGQQILLCSEVGAAFGTNGLNYARARSRGSLKSFSSSKFILSKSDTEVNFATPAAPNAQLLQSIGYGAMPYEERVKLDNISKNIPVGDARWVGGLLAQLTHKQLEDAFRAGHFEPAEADAYVALIESRIAMLRTL